MTKSQFKVLFCLLSSASILSAHAVEIDNSIDSSQVGAWAVDVSTGGESNQANLTAKRADTNEIDSGDVLFDFFTYIDTGNGGFRLSDTVISNPAIGSGNSVSSAGSFTGSNGNTVTWTATSIIQPNTTEMINTYIFNVAEGSGGLGNITLLQYLDADIDSDQPTSDSFFTRGSVASGNLELHTIQFDPTSDNQGKFGLSLSGGLAPSISDPLVQAQALVETTSDALTSELILENAEFTGWAVESFGADNEGDMEAAIIAGTQNLSIDGVIGNLPSEVSADEFGAFAQGRPINNVFGPIDVTTAMAWQVAVDANSATITTVLNGVPGVPQIDPPPPPMPTPATWCVMGLGLVLMRLSSARFRIRKA